MNKETKRETTFVIGEPSDEQIKEFAEAALALIEKLNRGSRDYEDMVDQIISDNKTSNGDDYDSNLPEGVI